MTSQINFHSTQNFSLGQLLSSTQPNNFTWNDPPLPLNSEITEVSIPGIDATVIVDVLNSQLTNKHSNIVNTI